MTEQNGLSYDAWKEYLKNDKEMKEKWKSLTELSRNVNKDLKNNLESLPYAEALRRRKFLTEKNIFNIINTAKEKPNFTWIQKIIYNEEDERHEYVIQCIDPSSDYIFRKIKEERGVTNMHGESINKYLQPVADKIWALKAALRVSIQTDTKASDLSYESVKMRDVVADEGAENHYAGNDRDIVDENGDVIPNPKNEFIPVESHDGEAVDEERRDHKKSENLNKRFEPKQLEIPFDIDD